MRSTRLGVDLAKIHEMLRNSSDPRRKPSSGEMKSYEIAARGSFELKPGGAHLMLVNLKAPFKEGAKVPLTLRFERAGEVRTELHVGRLDASAQQH